MDFILNENKCIQINGFILASVRSHGSAVGRGVPGSDLLFTTITGIPEIAVWRTCCRKCERWQKDQVEGSHVLWERKGGSLDQGGISRDGASRQTQGTFLGEGALKTRFLYTIS